MKKLLILPLVLALAGLTGCKTANPQLGPLALQTGVSIGVSAALRNSPSARPGVTAAKEIICAVASGTNANPATIVAGLDAYWGHGQNDTAYLVVLGAVNMLNLATQGISVTNNAAVQPYVAATCAGLRLALDASAPTASVTGPRPVDNPANWPLPR